MSGFSSELNPNDICAGVFVASKNAYMPVSAQPVYEEPNHGYRLWEYADSTQKVRACLLHVQPGHSAGWRILESAQDVGYYEIQQAVAGNGALEVHKANGETVAYSVSPSELPESIPIAPGDAFTLSADRAQQAGAYVLACFPGAAFEPDFEETLR